MLGSNNLAPSATQEFALIATAQLPLQRAIMRGTTLPAASIIYDVRALAALEMRAVNKRGRGTPAKKEDHALARRAPSMRTPAGAPAA